MINLEELLQVAKKIAYDVGKFQMDKSIGRYNISSKEDNLYNLVTEIDVESEKRITDQISKLYPDHDIVGEEKVYENKNSDYKWIIDPIDGTTNFIKKIPFWAVSIACTYKNETVVGVVYNPYTQDMYCAKKGSGAFKNDEAIRASLNDKIDGGLYIVGFYYNRGDKVKKTLDVISKILSMNSLGIRRLGAASLDMCMVAQGSAEAYFEYRLSVWDFAAAMLIVKESGGNVMDFYGNAKKLESGPIIASNSKVDIELIKIIKETFID